MQSMQSGEGLITEEELYSAIMSFKPGNTPGIDGIPIEVFFDLVKGPMLSLSSYLIPFLLKQGHSSQFPYKS